MMYVHVWNKYLPIIKILMKRAATGNQALDLNRIDFEKAGSGRKAGYKFSIEFKQGKVANVISSSALATDLAAVLMNDPASKAIMANIDVTISLNPKFQLFIVNKNAAEKPKDEEPKEEEPKNEELQLHNTDSSEELN